MTIELYGGNRTRAVIVQWYLEELGLPYEYISLDLSAGDHRKPEFLAVNPMGKVPALNDGDYQIWESGAILLYLADRYGKTPPNPESRATQAQWVLFANATLALAIFLDDRRDKELPKLLPSLDRILQQQPFLTGDTLTVADIAVASYLNYGRQLMSLDYSAYPAMMGYLERLGQREAFQKAFLGRQI
jgi:glutathione S-transferase